MKESPSGRVLVQHKLFYAVMDFYPEGKLKRKPKWIPTGLPERGNKRKAQQIMEVLRPIFRRDGTLIDKYANEINPVSKIERDIPELPKTTLDTLKKMYGQNIVTNTEKSLEKAVTQSHDVTTIVQEQPEFIRQMLFADYMVMWLEQLYASGLKRNTYGSYKQTIHGFIFPFFHDLGVTVEDLCPGHIEAYYQSRRLNSDVKANTLLHDHSYIRKALQQLFIARTIMYNPADLVNRPVRTDFIPNYYDEQQINEYLQIIKGTKMELPVIFASFYGFRRSEALGVKDSAINFQRKQLLVRHTVTNALVDHKFELIKENSTKSRRSTRNMPLVDVLETAILESQERQGDYRRKLGSLYEAEDLHYLCKDERGKLLMPDYVTVTHKKILEQNKMPHIRFHDLRHPYVKPRLKLLYHHPLSQNRRNPQNQRLPNLFQSGYPGIHKLCPQAALPACG